MDEFVNQNNTQQPENTNGGSANPTTPPPQQNPYYQNQGFSQQNVNYQGNMTYPTSPAGYNTNQQYNPQPQFGTAQDSQYQPQTFNTSPYENPIKKKQSKTGKSVFAILIILCIAVASILIGISISGDDAQFGNGSSSSQNSQKIEGATPDVEKSPYEAEEYSGKGAMTPTQIYDAVKETNVGILVYYQNQQAGEGSGVIVGEKDGYTYIITCAHVIADKGVDVQVQFHDSTELDADIVGVDSKTDIGVVRVKKTGFKAATFGDSDSLKVGTSVYAIGNPGGTEFFGSFTNGIVSSLDRPIATSSNGFY
ncbi:MAG: trypsin-like peptidase domain-containing protein, partial [Clostridia bacterium]|nr:trypsin-like peptidase domain-containing protein [Clostridia bacterium]